MNVLDHLVKTVALILQRLDKLPVFVWGTVSDSSEMLVTLDSSEEVAASACLLHGLTEDLRVLCVMFGNRLIIVGANGGIPPPPPTPPRPTPLIPTDNKVIVNGREYQAGGVFASIPTPYSKANFPPIYCGHYNFPTPYVPPPGYGFTVHILGTTGWPAGLEVFAQNSSTINTRFMQVGASSLSLQRVGWQLVRI